MSDVRSSILDRILAHPCYEHADRGALAARLASRMTLPAHHDPAPPSGGAEPVEGHRIDRIGAGTLFLAQPGTYVLANDVHFTAIAGQYSAIGFLADDITLDLDGHTITFDCPDPTFLCSTINVSGVSNITIQNGTLVGSYYCGIMAKEADTLTLKDIVVRGVSFTDTDGAKVYPAGLLLSGCDHLDVQNVSVEEVDVTSPTGAGMVLSDCNHGTLDGLHLRRLANRNGSMQGLSIYESEDLTVSNASTTDLRTDSIPGRPSGASTAIGFMPAASANLRFLGCTSRDIRGCCDDAHGMSVFVCDAVLVENFAVESVVDGRPPYGTGAKATGLEVYGTDVTVRSCSAKDITAHHPQDLQSSGFSAWGAAIRFVGCTAQRVRVEGTPPAGQSYFAVGFGWAPDPRPEFAVGDATGVTYLDCTAEECAVGFDTFRHVGSAWTGWQAPTCGTEILRTPGATRTLTCNPCSECDPPISRTVPNTAAGNTFDPSVPGS